MNEKYSVSRIQLGEDSNWEFNRVVVSGQRVNEPKKPKFADELAAMGTDGAVPSCWEWMTRIGRFSGSH